MVKNQLEIIDHKNKIVMDAGCGTAVLSIMAAKLGAKNVEAFDIDEWSVINGQENAESKRAITLPSGKARSATLPLKMILILFSPISIRIFYCRKCISMLLT
jgi:ribosomal protein L11 methyltransferase